MNSSDPRYTAARTALRSAAIMFTYTLIFTAIMAFTYSTTRPAIEAAIQEEQMRLINEILPHTLYNNNLLEDVITLPALEALGTKRTSRVWRARKDNHPAAMIIATAAEEGYAGRIELIVALDNTARVLGVRVTAHKETPGLGDYIDPKKDRNKQTPWISQFNHVSAHDTPLARWSVTKDDGLFDYHTGATISARAIAHAVGRAAHFAATHRDALFNTPAGQTLSGVEP